MNNIYINKNDIPSEFQPEFLANDFEFIGMDALSKFDEVGKSQAFWQDVLSRFIKNKGAVVGLICIILIISMAIIGPALNSYRADQQITGHESMAPRIPGIENIGVFNGRETLRTSTGGKEINKYADVPDGENLYYWFGSDVLGRDIFTRVWTGTRVSLYIALVAVVVDMLFGMGYGLISGYFGGKVDMIMQRFVEILNGIPNLIIVTLLIIALKPGLLSITIALMITGWIGMSRIARAQILKLKEQEFVLAAKTLGARDFYLIFKEILPNIFGQLLIMSMFSIPNAIFTEAFFAFIGIGIPVPGASLGTLISESFKSLTTHPYMILFPVIILGVLMLSFNLLADGLRDAFDPRMKEM
ncbi:MAG: ABC transporter permease [Oscillospiraceae bacterium]|jgi:oligopeptide transport system permease protein|nr:ABC transporter permease [Oscillospiraceae bacterium]